MFQTGKPLASTTTNAPKHRSTRFITRVIIGVVLINILAMVYAGYNLYRGREEAILAAQIRSRTLAQAVEQSITNNVDKIDIGLQILAHETEEQLALGALQPELLVKILMREQLILPESAGGRIFDATGHAVAAIGTPASPTLDISHRPYFLDLKSNEKDQLYISHPIQSLFSHEWAVLFARRYNTPTGQFAGVVLIPVKLEYFSQLMQHFVLTESDDLTLRYRDLSLIAHYPPFSHNMAPDALNDEVSPEVHRIAASNVVEALFESVRPSDHILRINTFHRIANAPFIITAGVTKNEFLQPWFRQVWQTIEFIFIFMLLSLFLVGLVRHYWRKQLHAMNSLSESLEQLGSAQAIGHLGTYVYDFVHEEGMGSPSLYAMLGFNPENNFSIAMIGACIYPDDQKEVRLRLDSTIQAKEAHFSIEYRIVRQTDGMVYWVADLTKFEYDAHGVITRMSGVIQDIGERKQAEERLLLAHEAFLNIREGIFITDNQCRFMEINPAFSKISGYSLPDIKGKRPLILHAGVNPEIFFQQVWQQLQQTGHWEGEEQCYRKDGSLYTQFSRISAVRDSQGKISRLIGIASDVTELREMQSRIRHLAYFDKLTNLPNRPSFIDSLQLAIDNLKHSNKSLGLCYLDLDGFKAVNDEWGHEVGDTILQQVAKRLIDCIKQDDVVARIGGDDFVVLLMNLQDEKALLKAIAKLHTVFTEPFVVEQISAKLTMSIGATFYPRDGGDNPEALIRNANQAMYLAKLTGKNRSQLFDIVNERRIRENHVLFARILTAYQQNEFQLYYQPKVNMRSGEIIGAEALIRWIHPQQGVIPPDAFLPLIENTEFSVTLGEWVTHQAMKQMAVWAAEGLVLPVSVNISAYHLQRSNFVSRLAQILDTYPQVPANWLELEILETTAMEDLDQIAQLLNQCMALGVHFALDDFGSGYSSLTYLRCLPTKTMKIDRSFVIDMLSNSMDQALVAGIIGLGHSLEREVIAEGVESIEHGIALMRMGCDLAQGYGIARPMSADKVKDWVAQWQMPALWKELGS
jgi:diguanylate cyclase (GGDEF)-like protein/PAS domain S-box-containing protein